MVPTVVQKYGGSSVADAQKIKRVAQRIAATRAKGKSVCVVVSAMGDTTDELLARAREISESPSRRELDMLLTCGERASMALLCMAISELGYEAISFTGSQCGIMTNDRHSGARIVEVRPFRVQDELERGRVVVVAGFQGVSYKREITTLGRGGSDTTAVALAAALGAQYCEICSDVDGVYSADPRVVTGAELRSAIDYDQMAELAAHGARVLHSEAVEFARRSQVALWARPTTGDGAGTRIDSTGDPSVSLAGVSGAKSLVELSASGSTASRRLLDAVSAAGLRALSFQTAVGMTRMMLSLDDVPDWHSLRDALPDDIGVRDGLGAVSVVGASVGGDPAAIAKLLAAAEAGDIEILSTTSSPLRVTMICKVGDVDALSRIAHGAALASV
jgi:aspartate kinase